MAAGSNLKLTSGQEIRAWTDKHPPTLLKEEVEVVEIGGDDEPADFPMQGRLTFDESNLVAPPGERRLYAVQHFFYTPDGGPLFLFACVYDAVNAEHALHQYLYAEFPERMYGRGVDHVVAKLYDSNFWYEEQEIRVFPLAGDMFF